MVHRIGGFVLSGVDVDVEEPRGRAGGDGAQLDTGRVHGLRLGHGCPGRASAVESWPPVVGSRGRRRVLARAPTERSEGLGDGRATDGLANGLNGGEDAVLDRLVKGRRDGR